LFLYIKVVVQNEKLKKCITIAPPEDMCVEFLRSFMSSFKYLMEPGLINPAGLEYIFYFYSTSLIVEFSDGESKNWVFQNM
jgi:hypothetical protein